MHTWRVYLAALAAATLFMTAYESFKELIFEGNLSPWESHSITIAVAAVVTLFVTMLVRRWTTRRIMGERLAVEAALHELNSQLAARTGELVARGGQLEEAVAFNRDILETSPVGVAAYRQEGECILVNPAFATVVGGSEAQLLAQNFRHLESWRHSGLLDAASSVLETGSFLKREVQVMTTFGRALWLDCRFSRFLSQGRPHLLLVIQDITESVRIQTELRAREQEFHTLVDNVPDNVTRHDLEGRVLYMNPTVLKTLGRTLEEVTGKAPREFFPDGRFDVYEQAVLRAGVSGISTEIDLDVPGEEGEMTYHLIRIVPELDISGKPVSVISVGRDMTRERRTEEELRLASSVFQSAQEGILVTNCEGVILSVNPAFTEITGYTAAEAIGRKPSLLRSEHHDAAFYQGMWKSLLECGRWQGEIWNRSKGGDVYLEWMTITSIRDHEGRPVRYVSVFHDITEFRRKDERIRYLAFHDALTGLPNRALFQERLEHAITRSLREGARLSVTFIDLDGFKGVNDSLGHDVGDLLLQEVARRIKGRLRRGSDTVARLGGDEFVVLMEDLREIDSCSSLAEEIIADLARPFSLRGNVARVGASMGIAFYPEDGESAQELMRGADTAMYAAKTAGKGTFRFFSEQMLSDVTRRLALEEELRHAIRRNELVLHYQPKIRIADGCLRGVEALVRWAHPHRGLVSPADFLPMAEESGLIVPLGDWVLEEACRQAAVWHAQGRALCIAVNVSERQISKGDLVCRVRELVQRYEIPTAVLQIELTETTLMADSQRAVEVLGQLREMGIGIAIDDFGTGYSSLSRLRSLPIDLVKIDRSFVMNADRDEKDAQVVRTIIALARNLGLEVIAEGVESEAQATLLDESGCAVCQGFHYGRPQPAEQLEGLFVQVPGTPGSA